MHKTDRNGSPETLVVAKSIGFQASKAAWKKRCTITKKHLEELESAGLKGFLGTFNLQITSLSLTKPALRASIGNNMAQSRTLSSCTYASNRVLPPITKRKIPQEIVLIDE